MPGEAAVGIAARRRQLQEALEFRQDQIEDLRSLDLQHPLLKEVRQRIRILIPRHLQDAFIHRQQRDPRGLRRRHLHRQSRARLDLSRDTQGERLLPRRQIGGERGHSVRQRAGEDFIRGWIAHELNADITVAFETPGQCNPLHRTGGGRLEPPVLVDAVALDGDQTRAGVRRADTYLDGVATRVRWLIELDLELGVAIQRLREIRLARHAVAELVQLRACRIAQHQHKISRLLRGQREVAAAHRDTYLAAVAHNLLPPRDILIRLVVLLGQHGDVLALHPFQRQSVRRHRI